MRLEQTDTHVAAPAQPGRPSASTTQAAAPTWEGRLYSGLRVVHVPPELRASLIEAFGETGVEAEHLLALVHSVLHARTASRELGDLFLRRLDASARRLAKAADRLEVATQGYIAALELMDTGVREAAAQEDVWWLEQTAASSSTEPVESFELRMRRCGFAYRHVVAVRLAVNVEAVSDYATQLLRALGTLPPAGILPVGSLYRGLDELTSALQGYVVPNHIADLSDQTPGLLTGIARLYALDAYEDTSIQSDIVWAQAQLAAAQNVQAHLGAGRMGATGHGADWAVATVAEWRETVAALEGLRASSSRTGAE